MAISISIKSPLEKEKRIIKVKQTTIAGPRSPKTRYIRMAPPMATKAKEKKYQRFCQLRYSAMKRSLLAKNRRGIK